MKKVAKDNLTRRNFIRTSTIILGGITIVPRSVLGRGFIAPSDKINLGVIGLGKQGSGLAKGFISETQAQIVAGSDVWTQKMVAFQNNVETWYAEKRDVNEFKGVKTYLDYKELIARADIDAVIVATPDHWHAINAIDAMEAGKDIFCEKPMTNTISEGIAMVKSVKKNNIVFQTGSMQRSWEIFRIAQEIVSSGKLGEITKVLVNVGDPARKYDLPGEPMPDGLDWNRWCGPAPLLAYNNRIAPEIVDFYPDWRFFKETGGGILSDWGAHMFDIVQWALGMDHSGPVEYVPPKEKGAVRGIKMYYDNGVEMVHEDFGRDFAVRFIGSEGNLDVSRSFLETDPISILASIPGASEEKPFNDRGNHYENWLSAIRNRSETICPVTTGHRTATICNIANMAYELGRPLKWDPVKEKFVGDKEANKMKKRKRRKY